MAKHYKSEILAAVHESAEALHRIGSIDKRTMKEFDDACLMSPRGNAEPKNRAAQPCAC